MHSVCAAVELHVSVSCVTRQALYVLRNIEVRSRDYCWIGGGRDKLHNLSACW